ncbi:universal stress protein [Litorilinea aerophila]|uniref:Universal stress protein n=1 Tax=Litorilinea aerophila TaxID=1204385 RepID=A0A540VIQ4_9CHLR|nr:universal stress protein [Litorilinea aerophila]MCC9075878.1 universal stress protein [Litorilinea aerophila]GIV77191.1 MAG: universal stress protein UspA [Litorilinea sp.]
MNRHKVLVPLDGSSFSRQILPYIQEFLPPAENELILLRVGERPAGHVGRPARLTATESPVAIPESPQDVVAAAHPIYASQEMESAQAEFQREVQAERQALEAAGYRVTCQVRFGEPGPEIVKYIELHDVDLVAMTTHGRTGLGRLLFGSVAEYVTRHISIPMMVLRPSPAGGSRSTG